MAMATWVQYPLNSIPGRKQFGLIYFDMIGGKKQEHPVFYLPRVYVKN
jgi:hypothetical protein